VRAPQQALDDFAGAAGAARRIEAILHKNLLQN